MQGDIGHFHASTQCILKIFPQISLPDLSSPYPPTTPPCSSVSLLLSCHWYIYECMYVKSLAPADERKHGICLSGTVLICLLLLSLVANEITPFFFFYGWKKNPCVCGPHFLSHSFAAGPHGWFCDCPSSPSASASMAGLSISVMIDVETLGKHSEVVWLSHVLDLALVFWGPPILISIVTGLVYIPASRVSEFPLVHKRTRGKG